jgi:hypothetical protein
MEGHGCNIASQELEASSGDYRVKRVIEISWSVVCYEPSDCLGGIDENGKCHKELMRIFEG